MIDTAQQKEITARKIKLLRKQRRWSQTQIANKLKITRSRYTSFESARIKAPYHIIRDLCNTYGITLDQYEQMEINLTSNTKAI